MQATETTAVQVQTKVAAAAEKAPLALPLLASMVAQVVILNLRRFLGPL
jgi:hypothetical protein